MDATKHTLIHDRFFQGGATSLRGFEQSGQGPHVHHRAEGGNVYVQGGLSVFTPLPWFKTPDFRGHMFVNGGILGTVRDPSVAGVTETVKRLGSWPSVSVGVGLVYRFPGAARVELNVALPVMARPGERHQRGWQFGIGAEFL